MLYFVSLVFVVFSILSILSILSISRLRIAKAIRWGLITYPNWKAKNESASKTPDIFLVSDTTDSDVELLPESPTVYYKISVTLMVIFSGLAIRPDGFNASIIGNLSLIFGVLYPDLSTVMYSRLSNAFIIGMIVGMF